MSVTDNMRFIANHPSSVQKNRRGLHAIPWIIIHTMEGGEGAKTAEDTALWLGKGRPGLPPGPAGVHFCVDTNSIVQMAQLEDVTAGAAGRLPNGKSANSLGVHIELAGRAGQTKEQWADKASQAILANAAALCREVLIPKLHTPVRRLTVAQMRAVERGFCGHIDVTNACNRRGGHWDPGPAFPWQHFLSLIGGDVSETSIPVFVGGQEVQGAEAYRDAEGDVWAWGRAVIEACGGRVLEALGGVVKFAATINGPTLVIDADFSTGRAFVPVRALCAKLGVECEWDGKAVRIG